MPDQTYTYTREQALADKVLYDVTAMAQEAGFRYPVAVTASLQDKLTPSELDVCMGQSYEGRLWDVLYMAGLRGKTLDTNMFKYKVIIARYKEGISIRRIAPTYTLIAKIGPGDTLDPVVTIGFPRDF